MSETTGWGFEYWETHDEAHSFEADWRLDLLCEAVWRAMRPLLIAQLEDLAGIDPARALRIRGQTTEIVAATNIIAHDIAEALRRMPATPDREEEAEAKLAEVAREALRHRFRDAREQYRLITDQAAVVEMRQKESELEGRLYAARDQAGGTV